MAGLIAARHKVVLANPSLDSNCSLGDEGAEGAISLVESRKRSLVREDSRNRAELHWARRRTRSLEQHPERSHHRLHLLQIALHAFQVLDDRAVP